MQVLGVEHDHVVQTLAPDGADEPLGQRILPRRPGGNELFLQAQGQGSGLECQAIDLVAIAQQVAGWLAIGKASVSC